MYIHSCIYICLYIYIYTSVYIYMYTYTPPPPIHPLIDMHAMQYDRGHDSIKILVLYICVLLDHPHILHISLLSLSRSFESLLVACLCHLLVSLARRSFSCLYLVRLAPLFVSPLFMATLAPVSCLRPLAHRSCTSRLLVSLARLSSRVFLLSGESRERLS